MLSKACAFSAVLASWYFTCAAHTVRAADPVFQNGDRVVLLGNTLVEREQTSAGWEWMLRMANPDKQLTIRNLGWSGDTVWAESRGMFDPPAVGYQRMIDLVRELKPTLAVLAYGNPEAFDGQAGLADFRKQYEKLCEDVTAAGPQRLLHLSPILMEAESLPIQSEAARQHARRYNESVMAYRDEIRQVAEKRGEPFVDFTEFQRRRISSTGLLTENGIHLSAAGYQATGAFLAEQTGGQLPPSEVRSSETALELRSAIIEKNRLFFHRWRPQNFTYLFGFRDHEQGQNAVEIAEFAPFVDKADARINSLVEELQSP